MSQDTKDISASKITTTGLTIWGVPEGYEAVLVARRRAEWDGTLLHVARDDVHMARIAEGLTFFAPDLDVLAFPAWDCLPYDRVSPQADLVSERVATLARLLDKPARPRVVLTTVNALVQRVPPRAAFRDCSLMLQAGHTISPDRLAAFLTSNGYARADTVMEPGEFAMRGGIVDLFPAGESEPVRLDFFGDMLETLRCFDPTTQRSEGSRESLVLRPVSELALTKDGISHFRAGWREVFGPEAAKDPLYEAVSDGRRYAGLEHWVPLFFEQMETLIDYLPNVSISLDHQVHEGLAARLEMVADHYQARQAPPRDGEMPYRALPPGRLYLDEEGWRAMLGGVPVVQFSPYAKPQGAIGMDLGTRPSPIFAQAAGNAAVFTQFRSAVQAWLKDGKRVTVAAWSFGSRERIAHLLRDAGIRAETADGVAAARKLPPSMIALVTLPVPHGFVDRGMALVSEQDLLGERISRPAKKRKRADQFIAEATEIADGDLVVHQDHGIGRYDGLITLKVNDAPHDCLRIQYDGEQKLFLPVENIEMLSRFGSETGGVALDKLGGASWQNRKARMKQRIQDMASVLIRTAASRKIREAEVLQAPEGSYEEFAARFPFTETEDQAKAIGDVMDDLASGRPMDRLICGDVGFGKTEVAMRAAYVAAISGAQVAVVVPTTLLARQHYRSFSRRFEGLKVKVAQLSRMVTTKDAAEIKRGMAEGDVTIVIGTHALLSKSISFANLGLLIVDEEQHFGVTHKEQLKNLREDVHVLTLTATPIPRTLQLALTGVREMSVIATPPVDRLAVRTFIMPFDKLVIREAIQRERFRGGQIFCVVPRLEDMAKMAERLREISPDIRIAEAHGRLAPSALEKVMTDFGDGQYDILLSTNIVESGLDMPAVNTLIIHRADMFGLGALYQLRGRVGRGKQRGYAYLTWPVNHRLTLAAEKRMGVMQTLDSLGAGFTLASHDLDIRGAGNLLGDEQSGHIREVGIELYQQMLEDAVADLKSESGTPLAARDWTPSINLGLPVLIPETYVQDLPVRLGLYRRIGSLGSDAETEAMAAELADRFGTLPLEVDNLLQTVTLKRLCRESCIEKLEAGPKGMVLQFRNNSFPNPDALIGWVSKQAGKVKVRPDQKLAITQVVPSAKRLKFACDFVNQLYALAQQAPIAQSSLTKQANRAGS